MDPAVTTDLTVDTSKATYPFAVFSVKVAGLQSAEKFALIITSVPVAGAGAGATKNYPDVHADLDGNFSYGPQIADDLFPDTKPRKISADVFTLASSDEATAHA